MKLASTRLLSRARGIADLRRQLALVRSFQLSATDLVLDVGSGQNPNLRADVLCDRFVLDASERANGGALIADRPLVVADAEELPFRDGAFDFVVCSHLLEHVRNPTKLLNELQRVARRGYIETPSSVHERLYGNPFHKWLVDVPGGVLRLVPKPEACSSDPVQTWFRNLYSTDLDLQYWINGSLERLGFLVQYRWEGRIDFVVEGCLPQTGGFVFASPEVSGPMNGAPTTPGQRAKSAFSHWMRRRSRPHLKRLVDLLVCSQCKGAVREEGAELRCAEGHRFEMRGNLIYMA
jgi:SAM-dependent methyltransferase